MSNRPAVIELVQTRGPRKGGRKGDTAIYWHARLRSAGNRRVTWWSEDYTRKGGAVRAIELLPGCHGIRTHRRQAGGSFAIFDTMTLGRHSYLHIEVREVDARLSRG